jgi:hypothetical protein
MRVEDLNVQKGDVSIFQDSIVFNPGEVR